MMLKKPVLFLGVMLLLALPVSASRFPEQLPSITKEEANSLGLIISYGGGGGGWEGSNYINFYQDFMCANHSPDYNNYIEVMVTYYTDNEAVEQFRWFIKQGKNYTDREEDLIGFWSGEKEGTISYHYEFSERSEYADLKFVYTKKYFDGRGFTSIKHTYVALVNDHYWVTAEASYQEGTNACNLEGIAPVLLNLYLSRIPNSTVRVPVNASVDVSGAGSTSGTGLSQEAVKRMKDTNEKLKGLGEKWGGFMVIKTPKGEVVRVVNSNPDYSGGGSVLGWKAKYYGNKALDTFIDQVANYLPKPLGLFKDYFKADKEVNVFSDDEMVKKTAKDLHVDERSASLYNGMSDIENREKAMSPYKNAVPSNIGTKPIEIALNSMGVAIKKTLAQDYRWEFEKTAEIAIRYKKAGMKYREVIRNTIEGMSDTTMGMHRVNMLDRNSKGDFKSQEARVRFYINKLFEEGVI
ncbi:hypothetical protein [Thermococcus thioreducens]|uniref:Uncharacterized protein n=1 Tax=Thermococcus thioreducens TaxID=277988 RepID=A0A0Q2M5Y9_9EURY|nr:hypothetical protein [Thermococcus thioreducens]ASJ13263.1 hypothetical protein A3L14_10380 [Thermococcus thioreducens]KQH83322.1 hypothetical protein AMR53_01230 [Thermococcus thioreducens]SEW21739.1 hypothetical protein SAMN05216170_2178 [Thermococcus thioreducens]